MNTQFQAFLNALSEAVMAADFGLEGVIGVGEDPDDGEERIELHLFDAPDPDRRDIRTRAIDLVVDIERRIPGVDSVAFVFPSDLDATARTEIESRAVVRIPARPHSPRAEHRV